MLQIVLISHGKYAEELKATVEMIAGKQSNLHTCCLLEGEDSSIFTEKISSLLHKLKNENTIIFADLYGGTPCNVVLKQIIQKSNFQLISGMNLPMVLSAIIEKDDSVDRLIKLGNNSIINVKSIYNEMVNEQDIDE